MQVQIRKSGGSLIITIPLPTVEILGIEAGDYLTIPDDQVRIVKAKDIKA